MLAHLLKPVSLNDENQIVSIHFQPIHTNDHEFVVSSLSNSYLQHVLPDHILTEEWKSAMAVNILGTVKAVQSDAADDRLCLPSFTTFDSSIEPMSVNFFFDDKRWTHLRRYTEAGTIVC